MLPKTQNQNTTNTPRAKDNTSKVRGVFSRMRDSNKNAHAQAIKSNGNNLSFERKVTKSLSSIDDNVLAIRQLLQDKEKKGGGLLGMLGLLGGLLNPLKKGGIIPKLLKGAGALLLGKSLLSRILGKGKTPKPSTLGRLDKAKLFVGNLFTGLKAGFKNLFGSSFVATIGKGIVTAFKFGLAGIGGKKVLELGAKALPAIAKNPKVAAMAAVATGATSIVRKKLAARTTAKAATSTVVGNAAKVAAPSTMSVASKVAGKGALKAGGKLVPGLGLALGAGFAVNRASKGDYVGALGEAVSGIASTVPVIGTGVALAIQSGLIVRDISKATKKKSEAQMSEATDGIKELNRSSTELNKLNVKTYKTVQDKVSELTDKTMDSLSTGIKSMYSSIKETIPRIFGVVTGGVGNLFKTITGKLPSILNAVTTGVKTALLPLYAIIRTVGKLLTHFKMPNLDTGTDVVSTSGRWLRNNVTTNSIAKATVHKLPNGRYASDNPVMNAMIAAESMGNANANRGGTQYLGLMQMGAKERKAYGVSNPYDPQQSFEGAKKYALKRAEGLKKNNVPINPLTVYLSHQQGMTGLTTIWNAAYNGGQEPTGVIRTGMDSNGGRGKNSKQFLDYWENRLNKNHEEFKEKHGGGKFLGTSAVGTSSSSITGGGMTQLAMDAKQREADRKNGVTNKPQQMKKGDIPWNNKTAPYKNVPAYKKPTFNTGMSDVLKNTTKNGMSGGKSNFAPSSNFMSLNPTNGYEHKKSGILGGLGSLFGVQSMSDFVANSYSDGGIESNLVSKNSNGIMGGTSVSQILENNKRKQDAKNGKKKVNMVNKPVTINDILTNPKQNSTIGNGVLKTNKQKSNGGKTGNRKSDKPVQSSNYESYVQSSNGGMGGITGTAKELHVKVIQDGIVKGNKSINGGTAKAGTYAALINVSKLLGSDFRHSAAVRDQYHESANAGSYHNKGLAFDVSVHSGRNGKATTRPMSVIRGHMGSCGMATNEYYIKDEYKSPSANSTGGHIHFNFMSDDAANKYYKAQSGQSAINDGGGAGGGTGIEGDLGEGMFDNPYKSIADVMSAVFTSDHLDGLREIIKVTKADKTNNPAETIDPHSGFTGQDEYGFKDFGRGANKNGTLSENLTRILKGSDERQLSDTTGIRDTTGFILNKDRQLKDSTGIKNTSGFKVNPDRQHANTDGIKNSTGFKGNNSRQGGFSGKLSWLSKFLNGDMGGILRNMFPAFGDVFGLLESGDYIGAATGILKGMSGKNDPLIIGGGQYGDSIDTSDITYNDNDNTLTNDGSTITSNNPYHTVYMDGDNQSTYYESDAPYTPNDNVSHETESEPQPYYENLYNGGIDSIEPDDVLSDNGNYGFEGNDDRQGSQGDYDFGYDIEPMISNGGFGGGNDANATMAQIGGMIGSVLGGSSSSSGGGSGKYDIFKTMIEGLSGGGGLGSIGSNFLDGRSGKQAIFDKVIGGLSGNGGLDGILDSGFVDSSYNRNSNNIQGLLGNIISNPSHGDILQPRMKENSDVLTKISQMQFNNNMMMKTQQPSSPTIVQPANNAPTRVNGVSDGATIPISVRNNDSPIKEIAKSYLRNSM